MLTALCAIVILLAASLWRAQKRPDFDLFDLIMENGRVSKIAVAFMLVLCVTTWVIIKMAIDKTLTEGLFAIYAGSWVTPLVAKVIFGKDAPTSVTTSSMTSTTVTKEPPP